uniref:hypothetical protein n=1 Tax=Desulfobacca sp. TaxID=2067990 RepID=UPI00404B669E
MQSESPGATSPPSAVETLSQALQNLRHDQVPPHLPLFADCPFSDPSQAAASRQYLAILKELQDIREVLRAPGVPARRRFEPTSGNLPAPDIIAYALQIIGHTLRDIRRLLN